MGNESNLKILNPNVSDRFRSSGHWRAGSHGQWNGSENQIGDETRGKPRGSSRSEGNKFRDRTPKDKTPQVTWVERLGSTATINIRGLSSQRARVSWYRNTVSFARSMIRHTCRLPGSAVNRCWHQRMASDASAIIFDYRQEACNHGKDTVQESDLVIVPLLPLPEASFRTCKDRLRAGTVRLCPGTDFVRCQLQPDTPCAAWPPLQQRDDWCFPGSQPVGGLRQQHLLPQFATLPN